MSDSAIFIVAIAAVFITVIVVSHREEMARLRNRKDREVTRGCDRENASSDGD